MELGSPSDTWSFGVQWVAEYPGDPAEWGDVNAIARLWSSDGIQSRPRA